jgi:hypothetical protein
VATRESADGSGLVVDLPAGLVDRATKVPMTLAFEPRSAAELHLKVSSLEARPVLGTPDG